MERLAQAELVGVGRRLRSTAPVELARKTAELQVRVKALARSHVAIVVDVDGELYRCEAEFEAGPYRDRAGNVSDWTVLGYVLPYGHFDNKPASREEWAEMPMRRLGEYAKAPLRAWVEVTGSAEVEFMGKAEDAPRGWHSSVAYQNAGSGYAGSSATVSFSFTAGAGSDRAAFLFGSGSRDTRPTSSAITFGGGSPSVALGEVTNTYWRGRGAIVKDTEIDTGAKTVQFVNSGGSGTTYFHSVMAVSFTGVDQTTPNGTPGTAGADSGTALSITVSSPASDSLVVDGWIWAANGGGAPTIGADQTIRVNGSQDFGWQRYVASTQLGSAGGVMSWTRPASTWEYVGMAVEMKAASAGPTPVDTSGESQAAIDSEGEASKTVARSEESQAALDSANTTASQRETSAQSRAAIQASSSVSKAAQVESESALALASESTVGAPTYSTESESQAALSSEGLAATERTASGESQAAIQSRSSVVVPVLTSGASALALSSSSQVSKAVSREGESALGLEASGAASTERTTGGESAAALRSVSQVGEPQFGTSGQSQIGIDSQSEASAERTTQGQSAAAINSRSVVAKAITVEGESSSALSASSAASTERGVANESAAAIDSQSDVSRPVPGVFGESQLGIDSEGETSTVRIVWSWSAAATNAGGTVDTEREVAGAGAMAIASRSVVSAVRTTGGESAVALRSRSVASPLTPPTPVRLPHCYAQWW